MKSHEILILSVGLAMPSLQLLSLFFRRPAVVHLFPHKSRSDWSPVSGETGSGSCLEITWQNHNKNHKSNVQIRWNNQKNKLSNFGVDLLTKPYVVALFYNLHVGAWPMRCVLALATTLPRHIFRDCSRKYAWTESIPQFQCLSIVGKILDVFYTDLFPFKKIFPKIHTIFLWKAKLNSDVFLETMESSPVFHGSHGTCVSLAALSKNSLADSKSLMFFNSISKAWFNHFPQWQF